MDKKHYIQPQTTFTMIETCHMIAASGDETVTVSDTALGTNDAVLSRGGSFWDDDDE